MTPEAQKLIGSVDRLSPEDIKKQAWGDYLNEYPQKCYINVDDFARIIYDLCSETEDMNEPNGSKCAHLSDMSIPNAKLIQSIICGLDYVDCTIGYEGIPLPCIETVAENVMINIMSKFNLFLKL